MLNGVSSHRRVRNTARKTTADSRDLGCLKYRADAGQENTHKDTNDEVPSCHGDDNDYNLWHVRGMRICIDLVVLR